MGTRHLIAVQIDGDYKVAQYGQWDGYPSGQGVNVLGFLRGLTEDQAAFDEFKRKVRLATWIDEARLNALWRSFGARDDGMIGYDDAKRFGAKYPQFSRDTGAAILNVIFGSPDGIELSSSLEFVADSLFCEWAYVLDFDKEVLEVYEGFNKDGPVFGRFAHLNPPANATTRDEHTGTPGYFPVRLKATFDFHNLPDEVDFVAQLEPQEVEA